MFVDGLMNRSPLRGYNHNVRYGGRLYHVQTEDSGVQSPRVFTHLFHDGTILASKRGEYDAEAEVMAVQRLMQAQHKSMLRDLLDGLFDVKIAQFFREPLALRRVAEPLATPEPASSPREPESPPAVAPARAAQSGPPPAHVPLCAEDLHRALVELQLASQDDAPAPAPLPAAPPPARPATAEARAILPTPPPRKATVDDGIARSLDEVILAYLAEDE